MARLHLGTGGLSVHPSVHVSVGRGPVLACLRWTQTGFPAASCPSSQHCQPVSTPAPAFTLPLQGQHESTGLGVQQLPGTRGHRSLLQPAGQDTDTPGAGGLLLQGQTRGRIS